MSKPSAQSNHRRTLPQSALRAASSLREGAGMRAVPFIGVLAKIRGYGRFSSPLRKLRNCFLLPFNGGHSLSHAHSGVTAPSGREPGWGGYHSSGYSLKSGVTGDFHRPYGACHSTDRPESGRFRAIFIAPTELRSVYIPPFNRGGGRFGWVFCGKYGK